MKRSEGSPGPTEHPLLESDDIEFWRSFGRDWAKTRAELRRRTWYGKLTFVAVVLDDLAELLPLLLFFGSIYAVYKLAEWLERQTAEFVLFYGSPIVRVFESRLIGRGTVCPTRPTFEVYKDEYR